jgi:hypothetical protein
MPLTAAQTTALFQDVAQMGIPNATVVQLQVEGIVIIIAIYFLATKL